MALPADQKFTHATRLALFAWLLAAANVVMLTALGVLAVAQVRQALPPRFAVVEPGRLYRSGQPTAVQLAGAVKQYGIRTVLNLRNPDKEGGYVADEALAQPYGVRVVRLPITSTESLSDGQLSALRKLYGDPHNYPILVHCEEGHARAERVIEGKGWRTYDEDPDH